MFVLDENISESEVWRLRERGIPVRLLAEVARKSIDDENIIPVLHRLKRPTFFTKDRDFWRRKLVHPAYCLVHLDVPEHEGVVADYIRRFLGHPMFARRADRMGAVARVHVDGIHVWRRGVSKPQAVRWDSQT
jgi:hypothetical protein